ncbi:hypothetical protein [Kitasatospora sp. NPDC057223]|uniref:hypothetical protein n=1 Tax=Kitasatospora sp. NPDC057223 TaxID=3346055 RepID=UPI00362A4617
MTQPQPTPPLDLDAIQTREAAATAGPWMADGPEILVGTPDDLTRHSLWIGETCNVALPNLGAANAEFIAHARQDVPALLAEVTRLRAEQARLVDVLKRTQQAAGEDPATCESCGHLESAHDPDGERDCHASGARVRSCTCTYFIPCYPAPADDPEMAR